MGQTTNLNWCRISSINSMFYFRPWRLSHHLGKLDHSAGSTTSRTSTTRSFTSSTVFWSQKSDGGSNGAFFMMGAGGYLRKSDVGTDLLKLDAIGCFLFFWPIADVFSKTWSCYCSINDQTVTRWHLHMNACLNGVNSMLINTCRLRLLQALQPQSPGRFRDVLEQWKPGPW